MSTAFFKLPPAYRKNFTRAQLAVALDCLYCGGRFVPPQERRIGGNGGRIGAAF